jgi:hypothetical protein
MNVLQEEKDLSQQEVRYGKVEGESLIFYLAEEKNKRIPGVVGTRRVIKGSSRTLLVIR